jgi:hypothetical protein
MNRLETTEFFAGDSADVHATVRLTEALERGRLTTSEYAQLRYNRYGRSDIFRSLLLPLLSVGRNWIRNLAMWLGKEHPKRSI